MKKYILLMLCLGALAYGGYYMAGLKETQKNIKIESMAQSVMKGPFAGFVEKWDLSAVPHLFVDGAQVNEISKMLLNIKNGLGSCQLMQVDACSAAARTPGSESDYSFAGKEAIACPFTVSCEKGKAHGLGILFYENEVVKLFRFSLSVDKKEESTSAQPASHKAALQTEE